MIIEYNSSDDDDSTDGSGFGKGSDSSEEKSQERSAKSKKCTKKKIHEAIKAQYIRRDMHYINEFLNNDVVKHSENHSKHLDMIWILIKQQQYMYDNNVHIVPDRIGVERAFSLAKRKYRLGLIKTKLDEAICDFIVLPILTMNANSFMVISFIHFLISIFSGNNCRIISHKFMLNTPQGYLRIC